jgi:hypothetical protein
VSGDVPSIDETGSTRDLSLPTHVDVVSDDKPVESDLEWIIRCAETGELDFAVEGLVCNTSFLNH